MTDTKDALERIEQENGFNVLSLESARQKRVAAQAVDPGLALAQAEAEREIAAADKRMMALQKTRHMFFAFVRSQGRIRIPRPDLECVTDKDKIDVKVDKGSGELVVTFVDGGT